MKVSFYARLRPIVGEKSVDIPLPEGATVEQLLDEIVQRWPALRDYMLDETGALAKNVQLCVNGRGVRYLQDGLSTVLEPSHEVDIFPAVAGGLSREREAA
jgi:molybdopterin synthase sulfur carrier subunit